MLNLSVIVCTHNPRLDYFTRTLEALKAQTLPPDRWQLLVIDNASTPALPELIDLSWHPQAQIIREEHLGLTPARLRGIREAHGDLLVFVDDDNVLAPDYLATAAQLFESRADLGAVSGSITGEYETPPPDWLRGEYESLLAVRPLQKSYSSNFLDSRSEPCGAGLCVRATVARVYLTAATGSRMQRLLDRRGAGLLSGGDTVLAKTALSEGLAIGQFAELKLTHLIPSRRVQPAYLFSIYRHIVASGDILSTLENPGPRPRPSLRFILKELHQFFFRGSLHRRLTWERFQGRRLARQILADEAMPNRP